MPSLSGSKCLLARQMQVRAPIPTFICGFAQPFRLRYAGSRSRSPLTHASPLELRSLLQVSPQLRGPIPGFPAAPLPIPGFPAEIAVIGQEYDGKPGIHRGRAQALAEGIKMPACAPLPCPCATALPVRRCPACARHSARTPKTLCVANTLAERIKMPARAPDAGSCTHSHFHMRVRAAIPTPICGFAQPIPTHTCKPARAAFSTPGFPAAPAFYSRFPGRNGRHRAGIRRETWNPQRKRLSPRTQKGSTTCED